MKPQVLKEIKVLKVYPLVTTRGTSLATSFAIPIQSLTYIGEGRCSTGPIYRKWSNLHSSDWAKKTLCWNLHRSKLCRPSEEKNLSLLSRDN